MSPDEKLLHTHESPDIADWRARGWLPVHLAAEWGREWTEACDELATTDPTPEGAPDPAALPGPDLDVPQAERVVYIGSRFHATVAHALAGQVTSQVRDVNVVVTATRADVYWRLDTAPDAATARAMNVTALRLRERSDLDFTQRRYTREVHIDAPNWGLIYRRDDPRTWTERVAEEGE